MIYDGKNKFTQWRFSKEQDLEEAIQKIRKELFGSSRIYLEVKKLIGKKGGQMNIPDAYVLDLSSAKAPKLFVVENELSSHDHLRHIAVQILQFSLAFETNPHKVKEVLRGALKGDPAAESRVLAYATANGFENIDYLLEQMVHRKEAFNALVIIDEINDELENILKEKFRFPVELLTLERFRSGSGDVIYKFEPLLADVDSSDEGSTLPQLDPAELDTVVVPAQEEGFNETFIGEDRWHHIRMSAAMIPQIKWIATYRVAPISAITHLAKVAKIEPYKDTGKYELIFEGKAEALKKPIPLIPKSDVKALQAPRYTAHQRLIKAKDLNEAF
jgi:hypothetical protein